VKFPEIVPRETLLWSLITMFLVRPRRVMDLPRYG
jgi:hypothetical protein